jgi:hypothetical protein
MSDFSTFSQITGMRSEYFCLCVDGLEMDGCWDGEGQMEGERAYDAFGFSLALLEGVFVLELGTHIDGMVYLDVDGWKGIWLGVGGWVEKVRGLRVRMMDDGGWMNEVDVIEEYLQ